MLTIVVHLYKLIYLYLQAGKCLQKQQPAQSDLNFARTHSYDV